MYPQLTELFIAGEWRPSADGRRIAVLNPATAEKIGEVSHAGRADLDAALASAERGFRLWRRKSAYDRAKIMRKAAELMRERADAIAPVMTMEQGKPLLEARGETLLAGDLIEWFAEQGRRSFGQVIPGRADGIYQLTFKEPVGPVAAFTPWNFPINQAVRKISLALAAGCSIIVKGPEETPASCAALVRAFADAGVPDGVVNLVFGVPAEISEYLIPHPVIRKISFTGSTAIGKQLAALAGQHMKRITMELGGHAPAIVFDDADLDRAVSILSANKFRNAGQVCVSPTRFLVQEAVYERFLDGFVAAAKTLKLGDGLEKDTRMGPLAHARRVQAMEGLIQDAAQKGARIVTGGERVGNKGYFFAPTILTDVALEARIMNEEPFGPVAIIRPFRDAEDAIAEANRLPYGLASYAYTGSARTAAMVADAVEAGMMSINHHGLALPEVPFGGIKDSGFGSEGGTDAIEAYFNTKFVTHATT